VSETGKDADLTVLISSNLTTVLFSSNFDFQLK
jgi:hypothetical protein